MHAHRPLFQIHLMQARDSSVGAKPKVDCIKLCAESLWGRKKNKKNKPPIKTRARWFMIFLLPSTFFFCSSILVFYFIAIL
jgi:hypothetical protein